MTHFFPPEWKNINRVVAFLQAAVFFLRFFYYYYLFFVSRAIEVECHAVWFVSSKLNRRIAINQGTNSDLKVVGPVDHAALLFLS